MQTPFWGPEFCTVNPVGMAYHTGTVPKGFSAHVAGWEHVNLTGDYIWNTVANVTENHGGLRPLRPIPEVILLAA